MREIQVFQALQVLELGSYLSIDQIITKVLDSQILQVPYLERNATLDLISTNIELS